MISRIQEVGPIIIAASALPNRDRMIATAKNMKMLVIALISLSDNTA